MTACADDIHDTTPRSADRIHPAGACRHATKEGGAIPDCGHPSKSGIRSGLAYVKS